MTNLHQKSSRKKLRSHLTKKELERLLKMGSQARERVISDFEGNINITNEEMRLVLK